MRLKLLQNLLELKHSNLLKDLIPEDKFIYGTEIILPTTHKKNIDDYIKDKNKHS